MRNKAIIALYSAAALMSTLTPGTLLGKDIGRRDCAVRQLPNRPIDHVRVQQIPSAGYAFELRRRGEAASR